ncbi:MAG: patatin-like phospholipase family protein [Deltaproteobacteria bacterium]|nr:patatin-like phospholipase family protein [Deltaproteobacteria bacterium]
MSKRPKIGLALGGGGARGLAHIGVLKVLEREGVPVDMIVGTSMGAIIGAAYAVMPHAGALEKRASEFFSRDSKERKSLKLLEKLHWEEDSPKSDFIHRVAHIAEKEFLLSLTVFKKSLLSHKEMRRILQVILPDIKVSETRIPYAPIGVDLLSGKEVFLTEGKLICTVRASCAVPGFMAPVPWNGMLVADGAILEPVPIKSAGEMGADIVIGVDVSFCLCHPPLIWDGIDTVNRAVDIMSYHLSRHSTEGADLLIQPSVRQADWTDFLKYKELIREGEKAAEAQIKKIRKLVKKSTRRNRGSGKRFEKRPAGSQKLISLGAYTPPV